MNQFIFIWKEHRKQEEKNALQLKKKTEVEENSTDWCTHHTLDTDKCNNGERH